MRYIVVFALILGLSACQNGNKNQDENVDLDSQTDTTGLEAHTKIVKKIFFNVPSPMEISSLLMQAGVDYSGEYLNSYKRVNQYITVEQMALNLGVYGADLSYNRLYDQIQESVNYFSAIKKLSDDLGIPQDQGGSAAERLEANLENRDSLLNIISQTYSSADQYLKQNDRGSTASLIILGGWVEALYIASQLAALPKENAELKNSIAEQKFSLDNLIGLLNSYSSDPIIAKHLTQLDQLKKIFDKVEITISDSKGVTDNKTGMTTITSESKIVFNDETFVEILTFVNKMRNDIIK